MTDKERDALYDTIDRLATDGKFGEIDRMLAKMDVSTRSASELRTMLVLTYPASRELPSRRDFWRRAFRRMVELRGEEMAKRLLGRLE